MIEAAEDEPRWRTVAKQMVHAWNEGMASLRNQKNLAEFRGLDAAIAQTGFSDPERPESKRTVIGRSELLAGPRKE